MIKKQLFSKNTKTIELLAKNMGISNLDFCGLLDLGYNPHKAKTKGFWLFGNRKIIMPRREGSFKEVAVKNYPDFVKKAGENYIRSIKFQAKKELEDGWERQRAEKVNIEIKKYVNELAKSVKLAETSVEKIYQRAKDKMMVEYIGKRMGKGTVVVGKIKAPPKKLTDSVFKKLITSSKFSNEQSKFLINELPHMDARDRLELSNVFKNVSLLKKEENQTIKKLEDNFIVF